MNKHSKFNIAVFQILGIGSIGSFIYKALIQTFEALNSYDYLFFVIGIGALLAGFTYPFSKKKSLSNPSDGESIQDYTTR